jgi:hypothetical protein
MSDSLGLSIGITNLVAARMGRAPVMRRSILTLFNDRAPDVGTPIENRANPNVGNQGLVLGGFVERVGDPVPLVAADGSPHLGERVLVEALDAMARTVGGGAPIAIAVPAHWGPATVGALRGALRAKPSLAPNGVPAALIPDSAAALAALQAAPGLPSNGVVALVDLGGSGTSITLADAGSNFDQIGETIRYSDFSGDQIDQALLNHLIAAIGETSNADSTGTLGLGSLARLRDEARQAKERLSASTATVVPGELPGFNSDIRVTRNELEDLISEPLAGLLNTIEETLQRNNIPAANVSAVATVGGGANIPRVTQQLSERLRAPVVTTAQSQLNVAAGAALLADRAVSADAPTGMAVAPDAPTGLAAAGWAAGAAGLAASESATDGSASATFRALAWSQDDSPGAEPVPYSGEDYTFDQGPTDAGPQVAFAPEEADYEPEPGPLPWYKRPPVLFGAAAAAVLLAIGGLAITLTGTSSSTGPVTETATHVETGPSPEQPRTSQAPQTITVPGSNGEPSTTVVQPPPPPPPPPPSTTTTTTQPTTTTTTTTTTPTTTTPTTTTPPTTTATTTTPPTTTQHVTTTTPATLAPVTTT